MLSRPAKSDMQERRSYALRAYINQGPIHANVQLASGALGLLLMYALQRYGAVLALHGISPAYLRCCAWRSTYCRSMYCPSWAEGERRSGKETKRRKRKKRRHGAEHGGIGMANKISESARRERDPERGPERDYIDAC